MLPLKAERSPFTPVRFKDGTELPSLHLETSGLIVAFGDTAQHEGSVQERWDRGEEYLHKVVESLNTERGAKFARSGLNKGAIQLFSYNPDQELYKAPCVVRKTRDGENIVVVIYSYGPK